MPRQLTHDFGLDINEQHLDQMCVTNCGRRAYNLGAMCFKCWEASILTAYLDDLSAARAQQKSWCFTRHLSGMCWVCVQCEYRYGGILPGPYGSVLMPHPECCVRH